MWRKLQKSNAELQLEVLTYCLALKLDSPVAQKIAQAWIAYVNLVEASSSQSLQTIISQDAKTAKCMLLCVLYLAHFNLVNVNSMNVLCGVARHAEKVLRRLNFVAIAQPTLSEGEFTALVNDVVNSVRLTVPAA